MHTVYVACLVGGAVATALFALLGWSGGAGHTGHAGGAHSHTHTGHSHAGSHGATHHHHAAGRIGGTIGWTLSWLSPLTIAAGALWFGGAGLIAEGNRLVILFAVVAAVIGAALIRAVMNALIRASSPPLSLTAEGAIATVNATIRAGSPGEVIYTLEGLHRSLPARSTDGSVIERGTAVVITRRDGGFAWVERLDPLEASSYQSFPPAERDGTHHDAGTSI